MSSFSPVSLVAWIFLVSTGTSTSDRVRRSLTNYQVKVNFSSPQLFPNDLHVVIARTNKTINFNFTKQDVNYNVPLYVRRKDAKSIILDTVPIKHTAFYSDQVYDASVTLLCEEDDSVFSKPEDCKERTMSGLFLIDGIRHVIEPKKRLTKRFINGNIHTEFTQRHQVYEILDSNQTCGSDMTFKNIPNITVTSRNDRVKRTKINNIIEVIAVLTNKVPTSDAEIKRQKLYYVHVYSAVNMIFKRINLTDMSFGVNLIGFLLEPDNTSLYVFPNGKKSTGYLDYLGTLGKLAELKKKIDCDHLTLFSAYQIRNTSATVGLANVAAMCSSISVSLIWHPGSFSEVFTIAHEIGHSLSAVHDDGKKPCSGKDRFMMAAMFGGTKLQLMRNHFLFSTCSLKQITTYVRGLKKNCLLTSIKPPMLATIPTGQLYPANDQCRVNSDLFGLCTASFITDMSKVCVQLWCQKKDRVHCVALTPAFKSTCGNKKWCMFGHCVYDRYAPPAIDNCPYGDLKALQFSRRDGSKYTLNSCDDVLKIQSAFCQTRIKYMCCGTCYRRANPGYTTQKWIWPPMQLSGPKSKSNTTSLMAVPTTTTVSASAILKIRPFPIALTVLYLFQQLETLLCIVT